MGTEHNTINANDRYKGYTCFYDNASWSIDIHSLTHLYVIFCNAVDKRQGPWASCFISSPSLNFPEICLIL